MYRLIRSPFVLVLTIAGILKVSDSAGQTYDYQQIINKADSMVRMQVTQDLLTYFRRDSNTIHYDFIQSRKKYRNRSESIGKGEKTQGNFQYAVIFYHFSYKEPMINSFLHKGYLTFSIEVLLDSHLNARFAQGEPSDFDFDSPGKTRVDLSFIPKYVVENRACDFISMDRAFEIATQANIEKGFEQPTATLDYDNGDWKRYCWSVTSPLTKESHGNHIHGEVDTVTIDAVTGEVLTHNKTTYGPLH